jgi:succinyl-diaminopimelate desuccinylase
MAVSLDLTLDAAALTEQLVDARSVSGDEGELADVVESALVAPHLQVLRSGNSVLARTNLGLPTRVLIGGHLDTVPIADNVPSRRDGDTIYGCGTSDMKSSLAVMLRLAVELARPAHDLTWVFYDCEEIEAARNGLTRIETDHREWLEADLAILMEPTHGEIEAGCQGTLRAVVTTEGVRAHSARGWLGRNAIHAAGEIINRLAAYAPRDVDIDGCIYKEGLNAVKVEGGVAGNVIPDHCAVTVNFRFAPDRSVEQAIEHVRTVFDGFDVQITDSAAGALPGLNVPVTQSFVESTGRTPRAKYGWTDVSRFSTLGIPALNYGPGDPNLAHTRDEHVSAALIAETEVVLRRFLMTQVGR